MRRGYGTVYYVYEMMITPDAKHTQDERAQTHAEQTHRQNITYYIYKFFIVFFKMHIIYIYNLKKHSFS
jgi:hypothetical protein